ncbi:hypothetical protein TWF173_004405 [Orbilia oligospora]|nr:hypothetical protein TWF173_004405 [Orbilia oligospora]
MARFLFFYTLFTSLIATAFATKFCKAQSNPSCPTVGARALQCSSQISSCHLTVTKRSGRATVTKTIRLPTSTKFITKTVYKITTTISFAGSTYTQTVTIQSAISTFTTTESVSTTSTTSTSTEIAETTQIAPYSPCEDPYILTEVSAARPQGLTWDTNPSDSLSDCCRQCYHGKNCAYFARAEDGMCTVWLVTPEAPVFGCATDSCDWGRYHEGFKPDGEFS